MRERAGHKLQYRTQGKDVGLIERLDLSTWQINIQLKRQSRQVYVAGWASWLTHCPTVKLQEGDFGLSYDDTGNNVCAILQARL